MIEYEPGREREMMEPGIEKVTLSLDVDGHSYGEDETYSAEEINEAGGLEQLVADYADFHAQRIIEIHGLDEDEEIANPRQYVDVTEWIVESD